MVPSNAQSSEAADAAGQPLVRALHKLEEALQLIDAHAGAPELGARLEEVIEGLKSRID